MENNHSSEEKQWENWMEKRMERHGKSGIKRFFHILFHFLAGAIVVAAFGYVVMLLWNWLIPGIIGWQAVTYWEALGLLVLIRILFGGFGGHWRGMGMHRHRHHRNPIREKWMKMTPEEQKEFMKKRYCDHRFAHGFFHEDNAEKQD